MVDQKQCSGAGDLTATVGFCFFIVRQVKLTSKFLRQPVKMPTEKAQAVKKFLKDHVYNLAVSSSGGGIVGLPDYEIHPREFLEYAEAELSDLQSNRSVINCISNLKRAIDCQIDIFLYSLNLFNYYKKKRLGIDRKLGFIEKCGMFSKYSLSRINAIRNKLEHEYKTPKIDDIYVYFDIVSAFISTLEVQLLIGGGDARLNFLLVEYPEDENEDEVPTGRLTSEYDPESCTHTFTWKNKITAETHAANAEDLDELAAFIRYHILLLNVNRTYHGAYANSQFARL